MKKILALILVLTMVFSMSAMATAESGYPDIEITMLHCWNGGGAGLPDDLVNAEVCKLLYEKTGVHMNISSLTTSELESLNLMFASGNMPDLVNAPFWSNVSGEGLAITNAAIEGLLYDVKPALETGKYPNVQKLYDVGVASDFKAYCVENPDFNGSLYIIPQQTPTGTLESVTNWAYGVYCRKDILEALGVNAADVNTPEKVYELAASIAAGGFKDAVGNDIIPCGTLHNGCSYNIYYEGYYDNYYLTKYRLGEDGTITHEYYTDYYDKVVDYMHKMVKEGLFDVESFTQTSTTAEEKLATGKVAMFAYQPYCEYLDSTLYQTNPEMEYTILGPQINLNGDTVAQVEQVGRSGFPIMFMPATISEEKADAVLRVIDFFNSTEGWLAAWYGIEGDTYELVDGKPVYTQSYYDRVNADSEFKRNYGMNFFGNLIGAEDHSVIWKDETAEKTHAETLWEEFRAARKVMQLDGIKVEYLLNSWEGYNDYKEASSLLDFDAELERAFFADTEEEAHNILNAARQAYTDAGLEELCAWLTEAYNSAENKDQIIF